MSGRMWNPKASFTSPGLVLAAIAFETTNIGTNPDTSKFRGAGGLTGAAASAGVANSGPSFVKSITKTANNGEFLVTLQDGYRACWHAEPHLWGPVAGPADGVDAQICRPANEGGGNDVGLTFLVTTITSSTGAPAETLGRLLSIFFVLKDSVSGD